MASLLSKIFDRYIILIGMKKNAIKRYSLPDRNTNATRAPKRFYKKYEVDEQIIYERRIYTMSSKSGRSKKHIVFFHGGAYVNEISIFHWKVVEKIIDFTGCKLSVLDYPLAPEHNYKDTFEMVSESYSAIISKNPDEEIIFVGDSAGAGLALAFAQKLVKDGLDPKPQKLVLISPWVDLSISTYIPPELNKKDLLLNLEALHMAADMYASGSDKRQYLLSPIFGDFSGLPLTGIWVGTSEIVWVDMPKLKEKLKEAGVPYIYTEGEGMQHDYPLFPIPEGKRAVTEICNFII